MSRVIFAKRDERPATAFVATPLNATSISSLRTHHHSVSSFSVRRRQQQQQQQQHQHYHALNNARRRATLFPPRMTSTADEQQQTNDVVPTPAEGDDTTTAQQSEAEPTAPTTAAAEQSSDGSKTSASEILKTLREDSAADVAAQGPPDERSQRSMLGVYRDVDGKSNVWAVEPMEETDTRPQLSKTVIILVAAGFILAALLILPILPFTNPDQLGA